MKTLLQAEWVAPMDGPTIQGGAVVFDSARIVAVGQARLIRAAYPDAAVSDAGNAIVLPALVNAHTHLELSDHTVGPPPEGGFIDWLSQRRAPRTDQSVRRAVTAGVERSLRFGVAAFGDICKFSEAARAALAGTRARIVSYGEIVALGRKRGDLESRMAVAADRAGATDRVRIGISPHAPYTVEADGYRRCLRIAREQDMPLATHLAESEHEEEFLRDDAGPFRQLWEQIGLWDPPPGRFDGSSVAFAKAMGLLDYPTLLAHVNYVSDADLAPLAAGQASVVYCPRTHDYFGHPPHRWRDMLARGINVAVGTDSCASSPDLNIVEDLRLLHRIAPEMPTMKLWEMATIRAARAIEMEQSIGTLTPGKAADLVVFPISSGNPLDELLEQSILPVQLWVDGQRINL